MIAVLGATGRIGSALAEELARLDAGAIAITRRPAELPIQTRTADLRDAASLRTALSGARRLFLLTPHGTDQGALEAAALQAALEAGVEHIVKISGGAGTLGPNGATPTSVMHWASEQHIERSGLGFTFLRPAFFAQNLLDTIPTTSGPAGVIADPFGGAPLAMIDVRDIAACAAAVLTDPAPPNRTLRITGPRGMTMRAIADHLGLRHIRVSPTLAAAALRRQGVSAFEVDHARRMAAYFATGADAAPTDAVRQLTGHAARPTEQLLDEHRARFAPATVLARAVRRINTKEQ